MVASAVAVGAAFAAWHEAAQDSARAHATASAPVTFSATLEQGGFGNSESFWRSQSKGGGAFSGGFSGSGSVSGGSSTATLSNLGVGPGVTVNAYSPAKPTRSGVYRTLCVRLCDGYYFPVKAATTSATFDDDEDTCRSSCSSPARLFYYLTDTGKPEEMIDTAGRLYSELPTAFLYRTTYDAACTCRAQPWEEAALDKHKLYAGEAAAGRIKSAKQRKEALAALDPLRKKIAAAEAAARTEARTKPVASKLTGSEKSTTAGGMSGLVHRTSGSRTGDSGDSAKMASPRETSGGLMQLDGPAPSSRRAGTYAKGSAVSTR